MGDGEPRELSRGLHNVCFQSINDSSCLSLCISEPKRGWDIFTSCEETSELEREVDVAATGGWRNSEPPYLIFSCILHPPQIPQPLFQVYLHHSLHTSSQLIGTHYLYLFMAVLAVLAVSDGELHDRNDWLRSSQIGQSLLHSA